MFGHNHPENSQPTEQPEVIPTISGAIHPATANRLAIVLFSGTIDKLLSASIMATGAAAMGMDVEIFLTNWGALAFRKDDYKTNQRVSVDFADYQSFLLEQLAAKHATSWMENLEGAKEIGNVHLAACSHTMTLFDLHLTDLEPIVDEVTGVAAFIERARDSAMSLFIWDDDIWDDKASTRDEWDPWEAVETELVEMVGPIGSVSLVTIDREIDARGSHCPGPLMELIRGLKSAHEGEVIAVISTDLGSNTDIPLWVQKAGNELVAVEKLDAEATRFVVRKHVRA